MFYTCNFSAGDYFSLCAPFYSQIMIKKNIKQKFGAVTPYALNKYFITHYDHLKVSGSLQKFEHSKIKLIKYLNNLESCELNSSVHSQCIKDTFGFRNRAFALEFYPNKHFQLFSGFFYVFVKKKFQYMQFKNLFLHAFILLQSS